MITQEEWKILEPLFDQEEAESVRQKYDSDVISDLRRKHREVLLKDGLVYRIAERYNALPPNEKQFPIDENLIDSSTSFYVCLTDDYSGEGEYVAITFVGAQIRGKGEVLIRRAPNSIRIAELSPTGEYIPNNKIVTNEEFASIVELTDDLKRLKATTQPNLDIEMVDLVERRTDLVPEVYAEDIFRGEKVRPDNQSTLYYVAVSLQVVPDDQLEYTIMYLRQQIASAERQDPTAEPSDLSKLVGKIVGRGRLTDEDEDPTLAYIQQRYERVIKDREYDEDFNKYKRLKERAQKEIRNMESQWNAIPEDESTPDEEQLREIGDRLARIQAGLEREKERVEVLKSMARSNAKTMMPPRGAGYDYLLSTDPRIEGSKQLATELQAQQRIYENLSNAPNTTTLEALAEDFEAVGSTHPNILAKIFMDIILNEKKKADVTVARDAIFDAKGTLLTTNGFENSRDQNFRAWIEGDGKTKWNNLNLVPDNYRDIVRGLRQAMNLSPYNNSTVERVGIFERVVDKVALVTALGPRIPSEAQ